MTELRALKNIIPISGEKRQTLVIAKNVAKNRGPARYAEVWRFLPKFSFIFLLRSLLWILGKNFFSDLSSLSSQVSKFPEMCVRPGIFPVFTLTSGLFSFFPFSPRIDRHQKKMKKKLQVVWRKIAVPLGRAHFDCTPLKLAWFFSWNKVLYVFVSKLWKLGPI